VPGFAIQNSTPQSASVLISAVAPFMVLSSKVKIFIVSYKSYHFDH